jgi:hypothetical protein
MADFFIPKLVRLMDSRLLMLRSPGFTLGLRYWIFLPALILAFETFGVVGGDFFIISLFLFGR